MLLFVIIILLAIILWLISLKFADKIGELFTKNVTDKIKNIFK